MNIANLKIMGLFHLEVDLNSGLTFGRDDANDGKQTLGSTQDKDIVQSLSF